MLLPEDGASSATSPKRRSVGNDLGIYKTLRECTIKSYFANPENVRIFAFAYASDVSLARKALLITVPTCKFGKFHEGGRSILLSLVVYAILISIPSGVRFVPWKKPDGFYSVPSEVAETHK